MFINPLSDENKYRISTDVYEGPLDLLLDLIEKAQLDITKVALAQVTDQYLAYLNHLKERDPAEVSIFLVIAAKLLQIKSAALLPRPTRSIPASEDEIDPGEELARQLLVYKRFKQLAGYFDARQIQGLRTYLRVSPAPLNFEKRVDLSNLTLEDLLQAARDVFCSQQTQSSLSTVVHLPRITIREKIAVIRDYLSNRSKGQFSQLLHNNNRVEIVVTFLALLELIKRQLVTANQASLFSDIEFETMANVTDWVDEELGIVD